MLWKCCTQYTSKFGKLSSGHRSGKGQFSFQSQRKAMPKNAQTTTQLHSSHTLVSSVQLLSRVQLFVTPWIAARQASLSITNSRSITQTQVHQIIDAMQPSHSLSSPSPPAPNPSQHQSLFQWVNSSHKVAKVLEFQLQHHSFQRNPRVDLLQNGLIGSPCSPKDSQESSPTPQFKSINSSVFRLLHSPTLTSLHDYWKNHSLD